MVTKWLQIEFEAKDSWVLPIWRAVNRAIRDGRARQLPADLRELGLHISTRLSMLPRITQKINGARRRLCDAISTRQPHHEWTHVREGKVFCIDDRLKHDLLLDLDSLWFEFNSCCELMKTLFEKLYTHAGRQLSRPSGGEAIRDVLSAADEDAPWFTELTSHRNFFIHNAAPYFAVDLSDAEQGKYDLLIMKENLRCFDDATKFVRLSGLEAIVKGFARSKEVMQKHLIGLYE